MRRPGARVLRWGLAAALCMLLAAVVSFRHARAVADEFIGPPSAELQPFRTALIPLGRHPVTARWGWVFAYGDTNHDGVEVYVSPWGKIVGTNPLDLGERLRLHRDSAGRDAQPST